MARKATKLKELEVNSVDLVRAGANQAADICLYKSAEQPVKKTISKDDPNRYDYIIE